MKNICFSFILIIASATLSAQEILDNTAYYRAEYTFSYKKDSTKAGYLKDTWHLDICKSGHSYFYSRANQYRDSVSTALFANGEHWMDVAEKTRPLPKGVSWSVDKRFVEGKYHYTNKLMTNFYRAIDILKMPQWKLSQDTLTLNGYICHKASAEVAGRVWEVWYTPQIPINDGPWLLWGLPGLILQAKDSNGYFKFVCENIGKLSEPYRVFLPADNKDVKEMKIKDLLKAELLAETDFIKFQTAYLNITSFSATGSPKKQYFIPIFLMK